MLETFREHSKGWLAKLILALITVPFALWGIDSYLQQAGSSVAMATVDGKSITAQEYGNAWQKLRDRLQSSGKSDPAMLDDPALKRSVLDNLINARLLGNEVKRTRLALSDEQLSKVILDMPEFQQNGKFSQETYDSVLKQNQLTPTQFESRMRHEMLMEQARNGVTAAAFMPAIRIDRLVDLQNERREVSIAEIRAADLLPQVAVDRKQVEAYYQKNKERFRSPEMLQLEYVTLDANSFVRSSQVGEDELEKFYAENAAKFQGDEQRRASHILITVGKGDDAARKAARERAESVLAEVRKTPARFAELARKYSQDPGSAEKNGDLGLFGRGMMVKPFEEAVFAMAPGAISGLVESDFGYHIIKLTEISGKAQSFNEVKTNIRAELMYQKALAKFAEQAENFSSMVYEQSDSLQPVAKTFGVQVQASPWMSRDDMKKFFKNDKMVAAIFSSEAIKEKRNTEAIEAAPNVLVSARVIGHKPSVPRTFDEVASGIETYLKGLQATALAAKQGEAALKMLREGGNVAGLRWIPPVLIERKSAQGLSDEVMHLAYKIHADKTPAYDGVSIKNGGYTLVRISKVESPSAAEVAEAGPARMEMQSALSEEYSTAYLASLRNKAEIIINKTLLDGGAQP